jgi:hypothetical protein
MVTVACLCPPRADGTPRHPDGDEVQLRERLDFRSATTIRNAVGFARAEDPELSGAEILAILTDADGKPLPVTKPNLRSLLLTNDEAAQVVADAADERYGEQILGPLVRAASTSSPLTPTNDSTSASKDSPSSNPTPSSPSSTTTIPTAGTGTITSLPAGGSRSSRKSGTAA